MRPDLVSGTLFWTFSPVCAWPDRRDATWTNRDLVGCCAGCAASGAGSPM